MEYIPLYEDIYSLCLNTEKVMHMYSKELQRFDANTVDYKFKKSTVCITTAVDFVFYTILVSLFRFRLVLQALVDLKSLLSLYMELLFLFPLQKDTHFPRHHFSGA